MSFLLVSVWKSPYKRSTLIQIVTLVGHLYGKLSLAIGVGVFSLSSPVCFQFVRKDLFIRSGNGKRGSALVSKKNMNKKHVTEKTKEWKWYMSLGILNI